MAEWGTRYANAADDGAPYVGPTLLADSYHAAVALLGFVKGPNGETLEIDGEIVERLPADVIGDTHRVIKKPDRG
jgi:hypothetical protein